MLIRCFNWIDDWCGRGYVWIRMLVSRTWILGIYNLFVNMLLWPLFFLLRNLTNYELLGLKCLGPFMSCCVISSTAAKMRTISDWVNKISCEQFLSSIEWIRFLILAIHFSNTFSSLITQIVIQSLHVFLTFWYRRRSRAVVKATARVDKFSKSDIIVSPSILSANFSKLGEQVYLHFSSLNLNKLLDLTNYSNGICSKQFKHQFGLFI